MYLSTHRLDPSKVNRFRDVPDTPRRSIDVPSTLNRWRDVPTNVRRVVSMAALPAPLPLNVFAMNVLAANVLC
jgi:hypothetical protein